MNTKYIVITGGVLSGIGKGVTTASSGFFLSEKYSVTPIKLDGYLNIDPGTMNPHEHGEVFVLDDGSEVDMDFGHYERFLGAIAKGTQSISMGKIYAEILEKERRGDFLGKTVQMVPHVTSHICDKIKEINSQNRGNICLIEVGGTVGDIEVELYLEAIRQLRATVQTTDFLHIHLTYIPIPGGVCEQKTKPTQQSLSLLQSRGLFPDVIMARGEESLTPESRNKISLFSNLPVEQIFSLPDVKSIYTIPQLLFQQGFPDFLYTKLHLPYKIPEKLSVWNTLSQNPCNMEITIGIIGKYTQLEDSYSSIVESLKHIEHILGVHINILFISTRKENGTNLIKKCNACIIPGGFGDSGIDYMLESIQYLRVNNIPTLGICLGMQLMMIEFARNILGIPNAHSLEFDETCKPNDIITLLESQKNITQLGGTMRLGGQESTILSPRIQSLYKNANRLSEQNTIRERFRHRYEVNPYFKDMFENKNLHIIGVSAQEGIVQFIELDESIHPYYIGTQSHPELTSKFENPAPLFIGLIKACL